MNKKAAHTIAVAGAPCRYPRLERNRLVIILKTKLVKTTFLRMGNVVALFAAMFLGVVPQLPAQTKAADHEEHIQRIEAKAVDVPLQANEPPLQLNLKKLMELYKIPALSIAVIENYKIVWAKAYGVTDARSDKPVTTKTLFQAGSISKPVATVGALSLVDKGKLTLDENVNQKLKNWKVPENEFTKSEKVTLRRIMSHTAGLTVHGFPGYDVDAPVPTLVQIFNGEKPANTEPIRVDIVPGTQERYSGGGVTIEQQLVMDVTGKPFPEFMRGNVLEKIGMTDSSYAQPLPDDWAARTAAGTYADGKAVHGRWHIYPEMAAAGLWTTPTDLAKFAIEVALSKQGKANHVLSEELTKTMLTPVTAESGLGFFLDKSNPGQFGHGGADEGFQALLTMNANSGNGVAIMANSDSGNAAAEFVIRRISEEYGWEYDPGPRSFLTMLLVARARGIQAALQRYTQQKNSKVPNMDIREATLNSLGYTLLQQGQNQDAIAAFQRNVQEYPQSSNVYDSLGEAYMKAGQKDLAITNYEKALQLDPKNKTAPEALKKLKENK
jgi:CubicO group peptidase (beta-lactamase class C family)